jgi:hypothetical protein
MLDPGFHLLAFPTEMNLAKTIPNKDLGTNIAPRWDRLAPALKEIPQRREFDDGSDGAGSSGVEAHSEVKAICGQRLAYRN